MAFLNMIVISACVCYEEPEEDRILRVGTINWGIVASTFLHSPTINIVL